MNLKSIGKRVPLLAAGLVALGTVVAAPSALAVTNNCPADNGGYLWHFQNHGDSLAVITVKGSGGFTCQINVTSGHGNEFYANSSRGGNLSFAVKYGLYNGNYGPHANNTNTCFRISDGGELVLTETGASCNTA